MIDNFTGTMIILPSIICIIVKFVLWVIKPSKQKLFKNVVCLPNWIFYFSFFGVSLMLTALLSSIGDWGYTIIFGFTEFLILIVLVSKVNNVIYYTEDDFTYRTFFRKKYTYHFDEIKNIRFKAGYVIIIVEKKRFIVSMVFAQGIENFLKIVMIKRKLK